MALYVNRRRGSAGFTLIELLITITILVIVTMAAIPSFNRMMWRNRIITTSNEIIAVVKLAQTEAMIRKQRVIIAMDKTNLHHWTIYIQPFGTSALDPMPSGATVLREVWLDERLELVPDTANLAQQHKLQVLPDGKIVAVTSAAEKHVNLMQLDDPSGQSRLPIGTGLAVCSKQLSGENAMDVLFGGINYHAKASLVGGNRTSAQWREAGTGCTAPTANIAP